MGANDIQYGGTHYASKYPHWDMVADLGLDYYVAAATKYMTRHLSKNGRQDILKSGHYIDKKIELINEGRMPGGFFDKRMKNTRLYREAVVDEFIEANGIPSGIESSFFYEVITPESIECLYSARRALDVIQLNVYGPVRPDEEKRVMSLVDTPVAVAAAMDRQFGPEGYWGNMDVLWKCRRCNTYLKCQDGMLPRTVHPTCPDGSTGYPDGSEPTSAYVNQG